MRTNEEWEKRIHPKILLEFTPRLRKDLVDIPYLRSNIPEYGSYYIHGPTGSGKTLKAAHMYIEAKKKRYFERLPGSYVFIPAHRFFDEIKQAFDNSAVNEHDVISKYSIAQYLVLDDLGASKSTDWSLSMLQVLINNRYEYLLTTVITSNFDLEGLAESLGDDRIPSRINRMCKIIKLK